MTKEEAEKVIEICLNADGGCPVCAGAAIGEFCRDFPEFAELANQRYDEEFGGSKEIK